MHVLPSWDALKLKVALPSGKRLRRHVSNSSCASTESSSSRARELSESECSSDSETPRKAKSVSFKERVGVILIPSKEELDARSIWWSARELQGIRKAFYAHVNHLMQQQQQQQQQRDFKLDLPRLLAASQLSSIDSPIRIPEAKFTSARSPEVAQRAAAIRVKVR